jgi:membrane-bound lytic murein transglycosylase B
MTRSPLALAALFAACTPIRADQVFSGTTRFDLERPEIRRFVDEVSSRHGFEPDHVYQLLAKAEPQPKILEAMSRPAERVAPWWQYRERFLTEERVSEGAKFWGEHRELLGQVAAERGVPAEYIVAIIGVETLYGRITGRWRVLDALTTLAFDYPPRSTYFTGELESFLLLAREESVDPLTALGSYAGAMGAPQFMPSSYRRYAVDHGQDKRRDLWMQWDDVIASVSNYFREHGWQPGAPVLIECTVEPDAPIVANPRNLELNETLDGLRAQGVELESDLPGDTPVILIPAEERQGPAYRIGFRNFQVITRYNRSLRYAMAVHDLAQAVLARAQRPEN